MAVQNTERSVQMVWDLWGALLVNGTTWIQSISQTLVSLSVVVCDWCDDLLGIWLELGVPLGVLLLTGYLLPPSTPTTFPTHLPHVSATPNITAIPVKPQAGQTISND